MKVVIMAGGKGTRISSVASSIPKPMIRICGKPVLEHEIECLRDQGFTDIIITVCHLSKVIIDYFGDGSKVSPVTGHQFGVKISYYIENKPLGNAGALFMLKDKLSEDFLLLNADSVFDVDFKRFVEYHQLKGGLVTILTHANSHPYDSGLIMTNKSNAVTMWLSKEEQRPTYYKNRVNAGIHIISPRVLDPLLNFPKIDLDRQILKPLAGTGKMFSYDSPEYVMDMGTPDRLTSLCNDFQNGKIFEKNLKNKQRAIFLDRDGTINKHVGYLKRLEDFSLLPGVAESIRKINSSGYLVIVVTNQPVIARGELSIDGLNQIHNKMETLLGEKGAYIDAIYTCPHHPDKGYRGECLEYKIDCNCRKPKPGMLLQASNDYNIDLSKSWMVGDSETDIAAGKAAGCHTALIGHGNYNEDYTIRDLSDLLHLIKEI